MAVRPAGDLPPTLTLAAFAGAMVTYTAMQVWAEAVEKAGTLELDAVIQ
jgi:hypothetical protein